MRLRRAGWARAISLVLAVSGAGILLLYPFALGRELTTTDHSLLPFFMLGVSGGFVHGIGYVPEHRVPAILFHPVTAWALMVGTASYLLALS